VSSITQQSKSSKAPPVYWHPITHRELSYLFRVLNELWDTQESERPALELTRKTFLWRHFTPISLWWCQTWVILVSHSQYCDPVYQRRPLQFRFSSHWIGNEFLVSMTNPHLIDPLRKGSVLTRYAKVGDQRNSVVLRWSTAVGGPSN